MMSVLPMPSFTHQPIFSVAAQCPLDGGLAEWILPMGLVPMRAAGDPEEDEELGDDDLPEVEPAVEESSFDDFDDEFDDDFEEEESDPDWDHPDDANPEPPPAKGCSKK